MLLRRCEVIADDVCFNTGSGRRSAVQIPLKSKTISLRGQWPVMASPQTAVGHPQRREDRGAAGRHGRGARSMASVIRSNQFSVADTKGLSQLIQGNDRWISLPPLKTTKVLLAEA